jgi:hypothetical protein
MSNHGESLLPAGRRDGGVCDPLSGGSQDARLGAGFLASSFVVLDVALDEGADRAGNLFIGPAEDAPRGDQLGIGRDAMVL